MESFAATKLDEFQKGKISRRRLIETLTLAATTVYTGGTAKAAAVADPALKAVLVNHISFNCPDYQPAADWYSTVFNLPQTAPGVMDTNLPIGGQEGDKPYNVAADDVPLPFLIMRSRDPDAPPGNGAEARRESRALIDGVAYTIADFDAGRVRGELGRLGITNFRAEGEHSFHFADPNGINVQISGLDVSALSD